MCARSSHLPSPTCDRSGPRHGGRELGHDSQLGPDRRQRRRADVGTVSNGDTFTAEGLERAVATILDRKLAAERADIPGLDEQRRDIIVAGAILLNEIVDLLAIDRIVVSEAALREGILIDRVTARYGADLVHRLSDIRRRSVTRMAERSTRTSITSPVRPSSRCNCSMVCRRCTV